jgi:SAM-dependent methyltransferase
MRRERLFSAGGFYGFLVDSNVLMHREAAEQGAAIMRRWLAGRSGERPLRVLDLACGGQPITIDRIMASIAPRRCAYTGIDINPDQVAQARAFAFADNVVEVTVREGDAWELEPLARPGGWDLVFSGMNLHHGTPQELAYLAHGLVRILADDGLFMDHDWFRPSKAAYRPRPQDASDPFFMVAPERLDRAGIPAYDGAVDDGAADPAWRVGYIAGLRNTLLARGADPEGAASTVAHVTARDFPASPADLEQAFAGAGLQVRVLGYVSDEPLAPYTYMPIAAKQPLQRLEE